MIYSKDINKRSPLRVFERSIHGGLGRGNVGLVMSRAGVGKTAFLVGVALDDCMRDRKVLHVDTEHNAERVREYYEEVFRDLAATENLAEKDELRVRIERNRMIHSFLNGTFHLGRLREALGYMKEHISFEPRCVVLDGHPAWEKDDADEIEAELKAIKELAVDIDAEVWLSAQSHREDEKDAGGMPLRLQRYLEYLSVVVRLAPESDHVRLQLVKDHDNPDAAALNIQLDPRTLLLRWR